jgi:hypothetical protein
MTSLAPTRGWLRRLTVAKRVSLKGKGAELFFGDYPEPPSPAPAGSAGVDAAEVPARSNAATPAAARAASENTAPEVTATETATAAPGRPPRRRSASQLVSIGKRSNLIDSKLARAGDSDEKEEVEAIRRVVKRPGREVSFVRLTPEEKGELAEVVYTYKRQGQKTTENEINRIAINALLADHRANGEQSILAKVLAALRS